MAQQVLFDLFSAHFGRALKFSFLFMESAVDTSMHSSAELVIAIVDYCSGPAEHQLNNV